MKQKDSPASIFHKQCSGTRSLLISSKENAKWRRESWQSITRIYCAGNVPMINYVIYCYRHVLQSFSSSWPHVGWGYDELQRDNICPKRPLWFRLVTELQITNQENHMYISYLQKCSVFGKIFMVVLQFFIFHALLHYLLDSSKVHFLGNIYIYIYIILH